MRDDAETAATATRRVGLRELADKHVTTPDDAGLRPRLELPSVVTGMFACANSIDGTTLLRHGGARTCCATAVRELFSRGHAPSTLSRFRA